MSTSDPDQPRPEPQRRRVPRIGEWGRPQRVVVAALFFFAVSYTLAGLIHTHFPEWEAEGTWQRFVVTLVGATIAVSTVVAFSSRRGEAENIRLGESRQRLDVAEDRLQQALRATSHPVRAGSTPEWEALRRRVQEMQERIRTRDDQVSDEELEEADEISIPPQTALALPELWETTHARLNLYHEIATGQAKMSFRNAQVSMVTGFALLILFVVLALNASTTAGAIVAGGLGAVSAALTGYVSKTFIRSQEAAATHLRSYFDQPLELSRYLAAERLVADGGLTQEQRGEVLSALVQAMVAAPAPPPTPMVVTPVPGQQGP